MSKSNKEEVNESPATILETMREGKNKERTLVELFDEGFIGNLGQALLKTRSLHCASPGQRNFKLFLSVAADCSAHKTFQFCTQNIVVEIHGPKINR